MTDETLPPEAAHPLPPPPPPPPLTPPAPPEAPAGRRRTVGLPVLAAVAAGTLLIGGLAGGIIGYAVHADGPDLGGRPGFGPGQTFRQGPDGTQPQLPAPSQDQQQDDGSSG